ncbi:MAG: hypothetical protein KAS72_14585 [Phycisphaerales bacterium]|nr:hypothetical protein [Phycisphaerales bacterium]
MPKAEHRYRLSWEDRFVEPTVESLREPFSAEISTLIEDAQAALLSVPKMKQRIRWCGVPWRWALTFHNDADTTVAWAYLVPDPEGPLLAVPIAGALRDRLDEDTLPGTIRAGLAEAKQVNGDLWSSFRFTTREELDGVLELLARKSRLLSKTSK